MVGGLELTAWKPAFATHGSTMHCTHPRRRVQTSLSCKGFVQKIQRPKNGFGQQADARCMEKSTCSKVSLSVNYFSTSPPVWAMAVTEITRQKALLDGEIGCLLLFGIWTLCIFVFHILFCICFITASFCLLVEPTRCATKAPTASVWLVWIPALPRFDCGCVSY